MTQTLKDQYQKEIRPALQKELGLKSIEAVPKMVKITVNTSSKDFKTDKEFLDKTKGWLSTITGQTPMETRSKKSIAAFNLREGDVVGLKTTLRGDRMYDFFQKLIGIVLPRIKDFQGVSRTTFDKNGNYTLGLSEQIVFPEIEYDKIGRIQGLEMTISTSADDSAQAEKLLTSLGMPFTKTA
ncbi:MAG: 50S ribosomal protein L5 [Candidatus Collierbacteria bacterium GW2011_GWB1_44_35]|uniref:Large ribosomal subunit protein uL5 n=3 Tax=Candidatus Collieribacteriota TaxID=1752725 RepID=A0A0G1LHE8_9BACT|nr:MAG: 50S ribosomal protein L5 [Candidatus Collierbacteria bacterium GW2011_GWA1_44_12]KKT39429.1 MAG: 50S ribosomal protein L5 [Candidatus Collierbacteria bacterium GW2011_GWF1_44_12]KKT68152.1 MAG: 50S ribosomal protein L5 [Candidatus Collierbacteria bacterium GW2011_GWB1_44_35]